MNLSRFVALAVFATLGVSALHAQQQPVNCLGYLGVTNVKQVVETVGAATSQYKPEMSSATLAFFFGSYVGDTTLANMQDNGSILLYAMNERSFVVFAETKPDAITSSVANLKKININAREQEGLLMVVLTNNSKDINKAKQLTPLAKEYFSQNGAPRLDLHVNAEATMKAIDSKAKAFLSDYERYEKKIMRHKESTQAFKLQTQLKRGLMLFGYDVMKQLKTVDFKIALTPDNINLNYTIGTVPGTPLAKMTEMKLPLNQEIIKRLPFENMVGRSVYAMDSRMIGAFLIAETESVLQTMKLKTKIQTQKLAQINDRAAEALGNSMAFAYNMNADGSRNTYSIWAMKDTEKTKALIRDACSAVNALILANKTANATVSLALTYDEKAGKFDDVNYEMLSVDVGNGTTTNTLLPLALLVARNNNLLVTTNQADLEVLVALDHEPTTSPAALLGGYPVSSDVATIGIGEIRLANILKTYAQEMVEDKTSTAAQILGKEVMESPALNESVPISYFNGTGYMTLVGGFIVPTKVLTNTIRMFSEVTRKQAELLQTSDTTTTATE